MAATKASMRSLYSLAVGSVFVAFGALSNPANSAITNIGQANASSSSSSSGVLQCVPFARETSGIRLYGDAHTWWNQAEGKYLRGNSPRVGAVMAIRPYAGSTLGHVATVSGIRDSRTILITHANWSSPGQIERDVTAVDMSPQNDWSAVRLWYSPIGKLGTTHWPVAGFIYNKAPTSAALTNDKPKTVNAPTRTQLTPVSQTHPVRVRFGQEPSMVASTNNRSRRGANSVAAPRPSASSRPVTNAAKTQLTKNAARRDPIGAIIVRTN